MLKKGNAVKRFICTKHFLPEMVNHHAKRTSISADALPVLVTPMNTHGRPQHPNESINLTTAPVSSGVSVLLQNVNMEEDVHDVQIENVPSVSAKRKHTDDHVPNKKVSFHIQ